MKIMLSIGYKDCILEGGMLKEERERRERFLNALSRDDYNLIKCLGFKFFNEEKKVAFMQDIKAQLGY